MRYLFAFFLIVPLYLHSEGPIDDLKSLSEEVAKGYFEPLVEAFAISVSSGEFHSAKTHTPLGFDLGVGFSIYKIPGEDKFFDPAIKIYEKIGDSIIVRDTVLEDVPTVFGPSEEIVLEGDSAKTYSPSILPGGFDISYFPLILPNLNVGIPGGFELTARYLARNFQGNKFLIWGVGVKASLNRGPLKLLPVNLALQWMINEVKGGDIFKLKMNSVNLIASKGFMFASLYAGFGVTFASASASYTYTYKIPTVTGGQGTVSENISMKFDKKTYPKGVIGVKFGPPFIKFTSSIEFGKYESYNLGLMLSIP